MNVKHEHPRELCYVFDKAWLVCSCGQHVDVPVRDGRVYPHEADALFADHAAGSRDTV